MDAAISIDCDPVGWLDGNDPSVQSKLGTGQVRMMPNLRYSASHPERL
jgi:hypothetical protein